MASSSKNNLFSVLLPFKNEREEVARTCQSIRDTAGDKVDIIVLNDDSDKDFDYVASLAPYNVEYHVSPHRLGSSLGKERCVELCNTPYFIILDAHCRIYTPDWLDKAIAIMQQDEDCVYCCAVQYFNDESDHQSPKHMKAYGGFWDYNPQTILSCAWNIHKLSDSPFDIPCILGANYICSKRWWNYIGGYKGLLLYGREETFISKKSWMAGGSVKCIPSILTGHKARPGKHQPYRCCAYEVVHNEMVCAFILFDFDLFARMMRVWQIAKHPSVVRDATKLLQSHLGSLADLKHRFNIIKKRNHSEIDTFNAEFQKKIGFDYRKISKKNEQR